MRIAAHAAVALCGRLEVEMRKGMCLCAPLGHAEMSQESIAYQVRRMPVADVDVRLAEMDRQELRMHIGDVHERDIAEGRNVVELGGRLRETRARP